MEVEIVEDLQELVYDDECDIIEFASYISVESCAQPSASCISIRNLINRTEQMPI